MGEEETNRDISLPLTERDVCRVSKKNHTRSEFEMTVKIGGYDIDGVMLDLCFNVNIFPKKSGEMMGKRTFV
jgi:hypothetical protein